METTAGVRHPDLQRQPAGRRRVGPRGGDVDQGGATVLEQGGQRLFAVLAGQYGNAADILLALQFMQARAQRRIGPVAAERRHQPQVDCVGQGVGAGTGVVAGLRVDKSVHEPIVPGGPDGAQLGAFSAQRQPAINAERQRIALPFCIGYGTA